MSNTDDILSKFDAITAMLSNVDEYFQDLPGAKPPSEVPKEHYSQHKSIAPELAAFLNNVDNSQTNLFERVASAPSQSTAPLSPVVVPAQPYTTDSLPTAPKPTVPLRTRAATSGVTPAPAPAARPPPAATMRPPIVRSLDDASTPAPESPPVSGNRPPPARPPKREDVGKAYMTLPNPGPEAKTNKPPPPPREGRPTITSPPTAPPRFASPPPAIPPRVASPPPAETVSSPPPASAKGPILKPVAKFPAKAPASAPPPVASKPAPPPVGSKPAPPVIPARAGAPAPGGPAKPAPPPRNDPAPPGGAAAPARPPRPGGKVTFTPVPPPSGVKFS